MSSVISDASFATSLSADSTLACVSSTSVSWDVRAFSFWPISLSHQSLCSMSSLDSSSSLVIMPSTILRTFSMGSAERPMRAAMEERIRLLNLTACFCRYLAARASASGARRSDTSAVPALNCSRVWVRPTSFMDRRSIALPMASNSPSRRWLLSAKSAAFCSQVAFTSFRYFCSSAREASVSSACAFFVAAVCCAVALLWVISCWDAFVWLSIVFSFWDRSS
mmetsp:Transcript_40211/g.94167  ORF Transcript_40211/g.94167 Transcript_40211/m.94167 type:complete len:223 (-) Transcript_40211:722-1390(-)